MFFLCTLNEFYVESSLIFSANPNDEIGMNLNMIFHHPSPFRVNFCRKNRKALTSYHALLAFLRRVARDDDDRGEVNTEAQRGAAVTVSDKTTLKFA